MMKKLRLVVGIVIVIFTLLVLFFWIRGYLLPAPSDQGAAQRKAAQEGVFNTGDPVIH